MTVYHVAIEDGTETAGDSIRVLADDEETAKTLALHDKPAGWIVTAIQELTPPE